MNIVIIIFLIFLFLLIGRILYFFLTVQSKNIYIKKKYKVMINNDEKIRFMDFNNIVYLLEEDLLISNKKCRTIWETIEEDKTYKIQYYGLNIPKLDMKYKVIDLIKKVDL
jgi:hypothetical protein